MEFLHPAMRHDHDIDFVPAMRLWLCNHDSKFTKWQHHAMWYMALGWHATEFARLQHPAMWHVALGLWHSIRQVAAPYNVACGSRIVTVNSPSGNTLQCHTWLWDDMPLNSPKRPPYWNSTSGFDFDHITAVDMSFCTSLRNFIQLGPPSAEKNDFMSIFKTADLSHLEFRWSNNGYFEKPNYITSYRLTIDTMGPILKSS